MPILFLREGQKEFYMAKYFKCRVCGDKVNYCSKCVVVKNPIYEAGYCSENCQNIWNILVKNGTYQASAEETLEALENVIMPAQFVDDIQRHIDMLFNEVAESQPDIEVEIFEEKEEAQEIE